MKLDSGELRITAEAIRLYRAGDPITNEDLDVATKVTGLLAHAMLGLGERYAIVSSDLNYFHGRFRDMEEARKRR